MQTQNLDIVIPLKENGENEELRYVLRSIAEHMPHRKIFLAGYMPPWARNVELIDVEVPDGLKYGKSAANTRAACTDPRVSEDFILFNDDFFVMKPIEELQWYHRGSLKRFHAIYAMKNHKYSNYRDGIGRARNILDLYGHHDDTTKTYELHIPMIFNKKKRLAIYALQDANPAGDFALHSNTLYGNINNVGGEQIDDVKYYELDAMPDPRSIFISTSDEAFRDGKAGDYIKAAFPNPCEYERRI